MNIQIIGDNFNISPRSKKMVDDKVGSHLDKLLTRFDPEIKSALLHIIKDKLGNFILKFDMNLPGKKRIFAQTTHKVFKSGLIDLTQEVERQIERYR
jgi:ribosome-associated translation inhibitor RaiA